MNFCYLIILSAIFCSLDDEKTYSVINIKKEVELVFEDKLILIKKPCGIFRLFFSHFKL